MITTDTFVQTISRETSSDAQHCDISDKEYYIPESWAYPTKQWYIYRCLTRDGYLWRLTRIHDALHFFFAFPYKAETQHWKPIIKLAGLIVDRLIYERRNSSPTAKTPMNLI